MEKAKARDHRLEVGSAEETVTIPKARKRNGKHKEQAKQAQEVKEGREKGW